MWLEQELPTKSLDGHRCYDVGTVSSGLRSVDTSEVDAATASDGCLTVSR